MTSHLRPEVMVVSCMHNKNMQYKSYYRNSLVIVHLAMGQIPRSTRRISSWQKNEIRGA